MIQFNLRVNPDLKQKISDSAEINLRSDNSEATYRLLQSFKLDGFNQPLIALKSSTMLEVTPRKKVIAERLSFVLADLQSRDEYADLNLAEFAYMIGMQTVGEVEMWFDARLEPSFAMIIQIAEKFGFNKDWLLWGHGNPKK